MTNKEVREWVNFDDWELDVLEAVCDLEGVTVGDILHDFIQELNDSMRDGSDHMDEYLERMAVWE